MKNINLNRLKTSLIEYWLLNKGKLLTIPLVVVVLYLATMFWYGTPLFNRIIYDLYTGSEFVDALINYGSAQTKNLVLFTVPLYLIICTIPYFKSLTKSVYVTLSPITRGERMLTLWIANLLIIVIALFSFFVADLFFVSVLKSIFSKDVTLYMEGIGQLYYKYNPNGYFELSDFKLYRAVFLAALIFACIFQLGLIFFRRFSIPLFAALMAVFSALFIVFLRSLYKDSVYHFDGSESAGTMIPIFIVLILLGLIATTYFKLREKEIY